MQETDGDSEVLVVVPTDMDLHAMLGRRVRVEGMTSTVGRETVILVQPSGSVEGGIAMCRGVARHHGRQRLQQESGNQQSAKQDTSAKRNGPRRNGFQGR